MKQEKIEYLDFLRVISTFAVIVIHVAGDYWYGLVETDHWVIFTVYKALASFAVPMFVMISGAVFLRKEKKVDAVRLYTHNILRLIVFLFFWAFCYQIYTLGFTFTTIKLAFFNILHGDIQTHLWFVKMIIGIYICIPLLKVLIDNCSKKMIEYALLLFIVFTLFKNLFSVIPIAPFPILTTNLQAFDAHFIGDYIGYFILGYYLHTYEFSKKVRKLIYFAGIAATVISIFATISVSRTTGIPTQDYLQNLAPGVFLWACAIFIFAKEQITHTGKWMESFSQCSLGIYAIHMLIIRVFWNGSFTTQSFHAVFSVALIAILTACISYVIIFVLRKIPILNRWLV